MTAVEGIDLFAALNATSTGVVLLAPEGTTRYANAAALRLFGRPSSDGRRPDLLQSVAYEAINLDRRRLAQDPDLHEALTALRSLSTAGVIGLPSPVHGQVAWVCVAVSPIPADATRGGSPDWIVTITDGTDLASARERARVSSDRLTLALRAGNLGLWDWDLVSGMLHLDGRAAATFGLGSAELDVPQTTISALVAPQDIARIDETIHEHLRGTVSRTEVTYRVRSAQGGYGTWVCSAGAVAATDPSGRARRIVGTVRDVTAAKALEEALIESEQRYRLIAEHACDIVARLSCSGEILYISPAAETLFGVAPEHLASRRISSVARREYQGIVRDSVERCVNRRTPTDVTFQVDVPGFGIRSFEMSLRHVAPVEDSRTGASLVAIIRDFTSRLRDIERMNRLGGILDRAHDLVLTACPIAGVITYANRSARDKLALDLVAGLGLTMGGIVPQMDLETIRSLCKQGNDRRTSPPVETEFLREGRTPVPVEVVFQMIDGLQAGTDTVVVIARDISARREIEEVRQDLISTLSHELRTPLSSLHAALDIVVHDLPSDLSLEAGQMLEVALRSSGRLIALTNDLLDISRIEAGVLDLQLATHDLSGLLRDAIETVSPLARTGAVSLSLIEGGSAVNVMVDADRFLQIAGNLLNNAIKFSPTGSTVEVAFQDCHDVAEVRIVDHGCGVSADFLPRLFTKFAKDSHGWQAGRPTAGTGLGLPIARALAEAMGGAIHHEDTPGGGATFVLAIPLEQR